MKHNCAKQKISCGCRFEWGDKLDKWCGKVLRCQNCGEKINYRITCLPRDCPHYEKKRWYKWRGWHPGMNKRTQLV